MGHEIPNGSQKKTLLGDPKKDRQEKLFKSQMMLFRKVVFALASPTQLQVRTFPKTKIEERIKKEKARKKLILNPYFQPLMELKKKDIAIHGNLMTGLSFSGLVILGL